MNQYVLRTLPRSALLLAAFLGLVLAPAQAAEGVRSGLTLCIQVIIPSLFPFFVLSALMTDLGLADWLGLLLEPVMRPLFRVGGSCAAPVAMGLVGGYPLGARTAITLYETGQCSREEALRLLAFCNNSGPAFLLGVVGSGVFGSDRAGLLLYLTHVLSALLVGLVFRFYGQDSSAPPGNRSRVTVLRLTEAFTGGVTRSLHSVLNVCAFVVVFSVVNTLLAHFGILSALAEGLALLPGLDRIWALRLLTGLLEVSSGVWTLSGLEARPGPLAMAAFLLGWGGLSVHCQALSFWGNSGLPTHTYWAGKLLHGLFAAALTWGLTQPALSIEVLLPALFLPVSLFGLILLRKSSGKRRRPVV